MATPTATPTSLLGGGVRVEGRKVTIERAESLRSDAMDAMVRDAVFGDEAGREHARWLVWEIAQAAGVHPWSINDLYLARGRGETHGFTVPAINVRAMTYDTARSIFRTAIKMEVGAFILEIARSEIAYTDQRPAEYVTVVLAAALREGFRGPVFIQGDHFQVSAKKFAADPKTEVDAVKALAKEAIAAGFYNIDVDTSTLVDLSKASLEEQQRANYETGADIAAFIRDNEPSGVTISIGGEIGEVGTQNSTPSELIAYMDGFDAALARRSPRNTEGLSKISVQSGTSHGGVVLADGSIADVKLDLETLRALSVLAREKYGMAGAVQHGASTLPDSAFHAFPHSETAEIHLATNFQNMLFDHLPGALRQEIYEWLRANAKDERKASDSDEQFFYKTRKKAIGPFKTKIWDLPEDSRQALADAYDAKFEFLFSQLAVGGTRDIVSRFIRPAVLHHTGSGAAAPDDAELSD
ncbi:MAG: class II fructose-bisphosphate aldolase [Gemmatimonadota bacterium]|nr:class II fructose-bisphosphate aldolase [Gemmatimonadota bacterium]